jgi:hypothetical protein
MRKENQNRREPEERSTKALLCWKMFYQKIEINVHQCEEMHSLDSLDLASNPGENYYGR